MMVMMSVHDINRHHDIDTWLLVRCRVAHGLDRGHAL
jgi:hypothetical protein